MSRIKAALLGAVATGFIAFPASADPVPVGTAVGDVEFFPANGGGAKLGVADGAGLNGTYTLGAGEVLDLDAATNAVAPDGDANGAVGVGSGAEGTVNIDGAGAALNLNGDANGAKTFTDFQIGLSSAIGTVNVLNGGLLDLSAPTLESIATQSSGLKLGRDGGTGTLNVDDGTVSVSSTSGALMFIGRETAGTGIVNLDNGSSLTVHDQDATDNAGLDIANVVLGRSDGTGTMTVDGGSSVIVKSERSDANFKVGRDTGSDGTLVVTGASTVDITGAAGEGPLAGTYDNTIFGGIFTNLAVGQQNGSTGTATVSDNSVVTVGGNDPENHARLRIADQSGATGDVTVSSGGRIDVSGTQGRVLVGAGDGVDGGSGTLSVTGANSMVTASELVQIGSVTGLGNTAAAVALSDGGSIVAPEIFLGSNGLLTGDGGSVVGNLFLEGGVIAPGSSPGTMLIDGDLEINSGFLEIEIAGTGPGLFDILQVTGDLIAPGGIDLELLFVASFLPSLGEVFPFLQVGGDASDFTPSNIRLSVAGLPSGYEFDLSGDNGTFGAEVTAVVAPVPLPAALPLFAAGLAVLGLAGWRRSRAAT